MARKDLGIYVTDGIDYYFFWSNLARANQVSLVGVALG